MPGLGNCRRARRSTAPSFPIPRCHGANQLGDPKRFASVAERGSHCSCDTARVISWISSASATSMAITTFS